MKKTALLLFLSVSFCVLSKPIMEWNKTYSGSEEEAHSHYVIQTSDDGFVQIGETGFIDDNSAKIFVVKVDAKGDLLWKKEYGTAGYNLGNCIAETPDGNLIAVGSLNQNAALIKINMLNGDTLWQKIWNPGTEDALEGVSISEDGGIIAVGYKNGLAENTFYNEGEGFLVKTDAAGNEILALDINSYLSTGYRVKLLTDGYLVMGMPVLEGSTNYKLVKFDFSGNFDWGKPYLGETFFWGFDTDHDGNIYLSGHDTNGPLSNNFDIVTARLTGSGDEIWKKWSGQPRGYDAQYIHDETWGLRVMADGGCVVVAGSGDEYSIYSESGHPTGPSDRWVTYLIKYNADGDKEWEETVAGLDVWNEEGDWAGEDVVLTNDGGCLVATDNGGFAFTRFSNVSPISSKGSIKNEKSFGTIMHSCNHLIISNHTALNGSFTLYDLSGRKICGRVVKGNEKSVKINTERFRSGLYLCSLKIGDEQLIRKIITGSVLR